MPEWPLPVAWPTKRTQASAMESSLDTQLWTILNQVKPLWSNTLLQTNRDWGVKEREGGVKCVCKVAPKVVICSLEHQFSDWNSARTKEQSQLLPPFRAAFAWWCQLAMQEQLVAIYASSVSWLLITLLGAQIKYKNSRPETTLLPESVFVRVLLFSVAPSSPTDDHSFVPSLPWVSLF